MELTANILNRKKLKETIDETLSFLSNTLSNSLGPYGSTTIIQDRQLNHAITKDGYSILKKIYVEEEEARTIIDLVKKISRNLVRKVGDGSTSSIIVANSLYKALENEELAKISPKDLLDILDTISKFLEEEITNMAIPVSEDFKELEYVASVSTNNDRDMGKIIREVFQKVGKYGFVHIEKSKLSTTYYDNTKGFEINRGVINNLMLNMEDKKKVEYENPFVFMTDGVLDEGDIPFLADLIGHVCLKFKQPLVIIAKNYSSQVQTFFHMNLINNKELPLAAIDISTESSKSKDRFYDLACNLGCKPHLRSEGEPLDFETVSLTTLDRLGNCKKFVATETYSRFIEGEGDSEEIEKRIKIIENRIEELTVSETYIEFDNDIYEMKRRLACLRNSMATLYVGGTTEDEKETAKYLVEDAVFACKSALSKGYIVGGNLIIPFILHYNKNELQEKVYSKLKNKFYFENLDEVISIILDKLYEAFIHSFECVLVNCFLDEKKVKEVVDECIKTKSIYNLKTFKYESMNETPIINSCETDIEIMKSAISIIGLLATSNQFVKINTVKNN